jgi:putative transposase
VFPQTKEQRCWVHATANVLDALPKRLHADAKSALTAIWSVPTLTAALEAVKRFADEFRVFQEVTGQLDVLARLLRLPDRALGVHLRTTNPIESTCSTVGLRTKVTRAAGSRKARLGTAYKLIDAAQARWRKITCAELVALVRAGATFIDSRRLERSDTTTVDELDTDNEDGSVAA